MDEVAKSSSAIHRNFDDVLPNASEKLMNLRKKWNVPETNTIAIGKSDVRGLEGLIFEGGSPKVRKKSRVRRS